MKIKACPRCGRKGSVHKKWVWNKLKKRYFPYFYVAHYNPETQGVSWCYVSRAVAKQLT